MMMTLPFSPLKGQYKLHSSHALPLTTHIQEEMVPESLGSFPEDTLGTRKTTLSPMPSESFQYPPTQLTCA